MFKNIFRFKCNRLVYFFFTQPPSDKNQSVPKKYGLDRRHEHRWREVLTCLTQRINGRVEYFEKNPGTTANVDLWNDAEKGQLKAFSDSQEVGVRVVPNEEYGQWQRKRQNRATEIERKQAKKKRREVDDLFDSSDDDADGVSGEDGNDDGDGDGDGDGIGDGDEDVTTREEIANDLKF